jgi:hypothetical protein
MSVSESNLNGNRQLRDAADPVRLVHGAAFRFEFMFSAHYQGVGFRIETDHVIRFTGRAVDSTALPHGKPVKPVMLADGLSPGGYHRARF